MPLLLRLLKLSAMASALLLAMGSLAQAVASREVTYNLPARDGPTYMQDLLRLALSYSDTEYTFVTTNETYSRARWLEAVRDGTLSLIWGGTSEQMEADFIPVRIDAYRGLMGHRIFIIRDGDQARFDDVQTLEDLQQIVMGQGRNWQDGQVLEHSGLTVVRANKKQSLFYMLDGGRFDAFPRAPHEAYNEVDILEDLPLKVEQNLVLVYPLPTYYFVNKDNPELARDIERGLEAAIADGAFDRFFYNNPRVRRMLSQAQLHNRRTINIPNPFLPSATPLRRRELWLTIEDFERAAQAITAD